ncbi:MAG: hypothetical protein RIS34_1945 [Pseudomonadota bacterium]|jgi:hypothetical protein
MNPGTTYCKTDTGRAEIAQRSGNLAAGQRRLLIMVDGVKTVNDLAAFVRVGELDASLQHLLAQGLIESTGQATPLAAPVAPGFVAAGASEAPRPATSPQEYEKVRQAASDFVSARLGEAAIPICAAIEQCDSPAELRKMLRGVEIFVGDKLSADTAQQFARHFGCLLI